MRSYHIVSMHTLMESSPADELSAFLDTFMCSRDRDRETFLKKTAIAFERKGIARTYVAIRDARVVGCFSLTIKCMRVPPSDTISHSLYRKMNVDSKNQVAQMYLLGQLGRSDQSERGTGSELLEDAVGIVKQANELVGCRVVRVDCSDELVPYYERHGFRFLCTAGATENMTALNQMVQII